MTNISNEIRAVYTDHTIRVYQAYPKEIAQPAVAAQKFVPPFKMDRMTWIKPSFLWMMYRSGWSQKSGQEHILAIDIKREGFLWALENASLSHFDTKIHTSREEWKAEIAQAPVRIQWDPERDIFHQPLEYRSIQIGLSKTAVYKYVNEWIVKITDITDFCRDMHKLVQERNHDQIQEKLPKEGPYHLGCNIPRLFYFEEE